MNCNLNEFILRKADKLVQDVLSFTLSLMQKNLNIIELMLFLLSFRALLKFYSSQWCCIVLHYKWVVKAWGSGPHT